MNDSDFSLFTELNSLHIYLEETKERLDNMETDFSSQFMEAYIEFMDDVLSLLETLDG